MGNNENDPQIIDESGLQGSGQDQQITDFVEHLVKNKGEKFRDIKEVAKAYLELEKIHGKTTSDAKQTEQDLMQLYGFYQTFNPYLDDFKKIIHKKDPTSFEKIFGTEELTNMSEENESEEKGQGEKTPPNIPKDQKIAKDIISAFRKDPEGVRQILLDILGPVLQPMQKQTRSLSINQALDLMEKDTTNFPHFNKVAKEMTSILNTLPDNLVPKTIEGFKYLYEAAVGRNFDILFKDKRKDLVKEIYKNISEKGFEVESDEGQTGDSGGIDDEVKAVLNARVNKL